MIALGLGSMSPWLFRVGVVAGPPEELSGVERGVAEIWPDSLGALRKRLRCPTGDQGTPVSAGLWALMAVAWKR